MGNKKFEEKEERKNKGRTKNAKLSIRLLTNVLKMSVM